MCGIARYAHKIKKSRMMKNTVRNSPTLVPLDSFLGMRFFREYFFLLFSWNSVNYFLRTSLKTKICQSAMGKKNKNKKREFC